MNHDSVRSRVAPFRFMFAVALTLVLSHCSAAHKDAETLPTATPTASVHPPAASTQTVTPKTPTPPVAPEATHADNTSKPEGPSPTRLIEIASGTLELTPQNAPIKKGSKARANVIAFALEETEVTVAQYQKCVADAKCKPLHRDAESVNGKHAPTPAEQLERCVGTTQLADSLPVTCVDNSQAVAYCASIDRRLPTAEEWLYAARELGRMAPSAANLKDASYVRALGKPPAPNLSDDGAAVAANVGSMAKDVTAEGLKDLKGNVSEWTASPRATAGKKDLIAFRRVVLGDSWITPLDRTDGTSRNDRDVAEYYPTLGFRCAKDLTPAASAPIAESTDVAPGQCRTHADCKVRQSCWDYRCVPCRTFCQNELKEAVEEAREMREEDPEICAPDDGFCLQSMTEMRAAEREAQRQSFEMCLSERCSTER